MTPIHIPPVERLEMQGIRQLHKKDNLIKWLTQPNNRFMEDL